MANFVVKEIDGFFYVGRGQSYYPDSKSTNRKEVETKCYIWAMNDAYRKAEKLYNEAVDKGLMDPDCFGDYIA